MKTFFAVTLVLMVSICISVSVSQESEIPPLPPFDERGELLEPFEPIVTYNFSGRPDIPIHQSIYNQIDLSIAASPTDPGRVLIGNWTAGYGVGYWYSTNGGQNWAGNDFLPQATSGAQLPTVAFDANSSAFILYRHTLAPDQPYYWLKKSSDGGATWLPRVGIGTGENSFPLYTDLTIDATATSPHANIMYFGYTDFVPGSGPIKVKSSTNGGSSFMSPIDISGLATGYFSRGVRLTADTYGNVFAVWAIYDDGISPEDALGFNFSTDGGASWATPRRAAEISGIYGRWYHKNPEERPIYVYSYPSIAVDRSGGPYRGRVYAVWADSRNGDPDIYFSSLRENVSTDEGATWAQPARVNIDAVGNGKDQWMPWVTVTDQGVISVVFYDSRNDPNNQLTEVWLAQSTDGGQSFMNYRVSDVAFTPYPVTSDGYMGTYMGITSILGYSLPCWPDNRPTVGPHPYQAYVERFGMPPQNVHITTVNGLGGFTYPKITWSPNAEPDLVGYELSRKVTGSECGASDWSVLDANIDVATLEYTDWSINTVGHGTQCTAEYKLRAEDEGGIFSEYSSTASIGFGNQEFKIAGRSDENIAPAVFALHEGFPNPFNPTTQIKFDMPNAGLVSLAVYDVVGRKISDLVNEFREAGFHSTTWNASNVASGVYFVRMTVSNEFGRVQYEKMNKLVLMK